MTGLGACDAMCLHILKFLSINMTGYTTQKESLSLWKEHSLLSLH